MTEIANQIRASARRLRYVTLGVIALFELLLLFAVAVLITGRRSDYPLLQISDAGLPDWILAPTLLLVGLLVGIALFRLVRMMARVEAGAPFAAASDLRGFAFYLLLSVIASVLLPPLLSAGAAAMSGGPHRFALALGGAELLTLLVSALLFFVARLLDEAQRLADDHSQIV